MEEATLENVMRQARNLTPDEQLRLAAHLIERAKGGYAAPRAPAKWKDLRGLAKPSLVGMDTQLWVSATRREADIPLKKSPDDSAGKSAL